jgi:serine/threonine-protein kinase
VQLDLGRYAVVGRLGRGGLGTVYLCRAEGGFGFRRLCALKVLRQDLSRDRRCEGRLLHEAGIAARVHHPNLVAALDVGDYAGQPYVVMEYVEGITLADVLAKARPPVEITMRIFMDALSGLSALHELRDEFGSPLEVVHCDVSPQNLLVGVDGVCRVIDFSSAKSRAAGPSAHHTQGRPAYMAPERIRGEAFDRRADVFAAGVVLHECLTGRRLFKADSHEETLGNVLNGEVPAPSAWSPGLPSALDELTLHALERDRRRRFQDTEAMLLALKAVALSEGLWATPADVSRWLRRNLAEVVSLLRARARAAMTMERWQESGAVEVSPPAESRTTASGELSPADGLDGRLARVEEAALADPARDEMTVLVRPARRRRRMLVTVVAAAVTAALLAPLSRTEVFARIFGGHDDARGAGLSTARPRAAKPRAQEIAPPLLPAPRRPRGFVP